MMSSDGASLVAGGRTDLHRKIGSFSAVLAIAMVVLGTLGALIAARRATGCAVGDRATRVAAQRVNSAKKSPMQDQMCRRLASGC